MNRSMPPIHHHECDRCTFLGVYIDADGQQDLYTCPQMGHPTVIARYGDAPWEYLSGLDAYFPGLDSKQPALQIAARWATDRGLL